MDEALLDALSSQAGFLAQMAANAGEFRKEIVDAINAVAKAADLIRTRAGKTPDDSDDDREVQDLLNAIEKRVVELAERRERGVAAAGKPASDKESAALGGNDPSP